MERSMAMSMGMVAGLMVGIILVIVLLKFANKDKKVKTEYDERQTAIKNKGYVFGFYTMVGLLAIESLMSMAEISFPIPGFAVFFADIIVGITVMCGYAVWNGVYWGMNNDPKRYAIIFALAIFLNIIPIASGIISGRFSINADPSDSLPLYNVLVLAMFAVLLVIMLIRYIADKLDEKEG